MPQIKMPVPVLLALTLGPAVLVGGTLWMANSLVPACTLTELERLTAPNRQFDLVTFTRDCGETEPNSQASLVPSGEDVPFDAASFFSVASSSNLDPAWTAEGAIELTVPADATVFRQDVEVAGIAVVYR